MLGRALARGAGRCTRYWEARAEILSGVSLGIEDRVERLIDLIARYHDEGYRRIKLKIAPGGTSRWSDRSVSAIPTIALQVDANSAYTLDDLPTLKALDEFGLLLIEQPLADDDIIDHARLQAALKTPICLDESIQSADDAEGARPGCLPCDQYQGQPARGSARRSAVHDLCLAAECRSGAAACTSSGSVA